ncbi:hypothetical protein GCM10020254_49660 [Streptomyces goshikiensis]
MVTESESPRVPRSPSYPTTPALPPDPGRVRRPAISTVSAAWPAPAASPSKPSHSETRRSGSRGCSYATTSVQPPQAPTSEWPMAMFSWATVHIPAPPVRTSGVTSAEAW